MSTIVVGVDGHDRSDDAIALAGEPAAGSGARLLLATAVSAYLGLPIVGSRRPLERPLEVPATAAVAP